jgi:hypothetical protein
MQAGVEGRGAGLGRCGAVLFKGVMLVVGWCIGMGLFV